MCVEPTSPESVSTESNREVLNSGAASITARFTAAAGERAIPSLHEDCLHIQTPAR
ncbi:hypothetical protein [Candidatus Poriferisodalis sp.]|uniref:hypothetical protein n=1 Tax=Candidatus Poriferisodalis sp. TaxID=3101277 RepID=UPI003B015083